MFKPYQCPFCLSGDLMISGPINDPPEDDDFLSGVEVVCQNCHASGPSGDDYNDAVLKWNLLPPGRK